MIDMAEQSEMKLDRLDPGQPVAVFFIGGENVPVEMHEVSLVLAPWFVSFSR